MRDVVVGIPMSRASWDAIGEQARRMASRGRSRHEHGGPRMATAVPKARHALRSRQSTSYEQDQHASVADTGSAPLIVSMAPVLHGEVVGEHRRSTDMGHRAMRTYERGRREVEDHPHRSRQYGAGGRRPGSRWASSPSTQSALTTTR